MMGLFSAASSLSDFSEASVLGRLEDKLQRIGNGPSPFSAQQMCCSVGHSD